MIFQVVSNGGELGRVIAYQLSSWPQVLDALAQLPVGVRGRAARDGSLFAYGPMGAGSAVGGSVVCSARANAGCAEPVHIGGAFYIFQRLEPELLATPEKTLLQLPSPEIAEVENSLRRTEAQIEFVLQQAGTRLSQRFEMPEAWALQSQQRLNVPKRSASLSVDTRVKTGNEQQATVHQLLGDSVYREYQ